MEVATGTAILAALGLTIPDPDLKWNEERGQHDFGELNWAEFNEILRGNGPCNHERLRARQKAWDEGAWVREAAMAHATKQKARTEGALRVA